MLYHREIQPIEVTIEVAIEVAIKEAIKANYLSH
ncbi:hypothetical protein EZMO1_3321 [Endozoicomonas montiporae CL-33]|uniref:Uncharacterized protein n=1 Tax=Endozoicomonas montiporae CL-33 TaxID=570277 RepID=A0A142BEZ2_9GAMM|nr:hypothetical protein EZMO1_3321 [Endozoicomonas montiporae CL-33]